jgi:hypothetical protein
LVITSCSPVKPTRLHGVTFHKIWFLIGAPVNVKVKLSLCLTRHYSIKVHGGVDV